MPVKKMPFAATLYSVATVVAASSVFHAPALHAAENQPIGGLGGEVVRLRCPEGMQLIGATGRAGEWIDGIAPVCGRVVRAPKRFYPDSYHFAYADVIEGEYAGGNGGTPYQSEVCWALNPIKVAYVRRTIGLSEGRMYVQGILLDCPVAIEHVETAMLIWGTANPYFGKQVAGRAIDVEKQNKTLVNNSECFQNYEVAVGFIVRAGEYIDAIGLLCGPQYIDGIQVTGPPKDGLRDSSPPQAPPKDITGVGGGSLTRRAGALDRASDVPQPPPPPVVVVEPVRHDAPSIRSDEGDQERLDYCLNFADDCGDAAAAAYCRSVDPARPVVLEAPLEFGIGRTYTIGDRRLCLQDNCSSFSHIVCGAG